MTDKTNEKFDLDQEVAKVVDEILSDYENGREIDQMQANEIPDQDAVIEIIKKLLMIIYPGYYRDNTYRGRNPYNKLTVQIEDVMDIMVHQVEIALPYSKKYEDYGAEELEVAAQKISLEFFRKIPKIREYLDTDLDATFDGDPAATNKQEIVLAYPGLFAISVHRIAHELHLLGVPMIPRIMSEYAHRETGVDIHPAATIGKYFFIDHATGIVVGSTSVIGEHVKVYQGVTIGALSTKEGHKLHGVRRHPTIKDNVTLYSGASVLGGETIIGEGSVVGGNAFVTKSIAPNTRVNVKLQEQEYNEKN